MFIEEDFFFSINYCAILFWTAGLIKARQFHQDLILMKRCSVRICEDFRAKVICLMCVFPSAIFLRFWCDLHLSMERFSVRLVFHVWLFYSLYYRRFLKTSTGCATQRSPVVWEEETLFLQIRSVSISTGVKDRVCGFQLNTRILKIYWFYNLWIGRSSFFRVVIRPLHMC